MRRHLFAFPKKIVNYQKNRKLGILSLYVVILRLLGKKNLILRSPNRNFSENQGGEKLKASPSETKIWNFDKKKKSKIERNWALIVLSEEKLKLPTRKKFLWSKINFREINRSLLFQTNKQHVDTNLQGYRKKVD